MYANPPTYHHTFPHTTHLSSTTLFAHSDIRTFGHPDVRNPLLVHPCTNVILDLHCHPFYLHLSCQSIQIFSLPIRRNPTANHQSRLPHSHTHAHTHTHTAANDQSRLPRTQQQTRNKQSRFAHTHNFRQTNNPDLRLQHSANNQIQICAHNTQQTTKSRFAHTTLGKQPNPDLRTQHSANSQIQICDCNTRQTAKSGFCKQCATQMQIQNSPNTVLFWAKIKQIQITFTRLIDYVEMAAIHTATQTHTDTDTRTHTD